MEERYWINVHLRVLLRKEHAAQQREMEYELLFAEYAEIVERELQEMKRCVLIAACRVATSSLESAH